MSNLNENEKDSLLAYSLGLPVSRQVIEDLISSNPEAAEVSQRIARALAPLDSVAAECPDALVRLTLDRLRRASKEDVAASPTIVRLGWSGNLRNVAAVATVAACIFIILGAAIPSLSSIRQRYYRQACLNQLEDIYRGVALYSSDHGGMVPAVARPVGATWAEIGRQGSDSYSNTRNLFVLSKLGYNNLEDFVCCGSGKNRGANLTPAQLATYDDFPSRRDVTYSYRLTADPRTELSTLASQPLVADMNPHFEDLSPAMDVCPSAESLRRNSPNHQRKGQNVLWGDGHARFSQTRTIGAGDDDIYTIADTSTYHGLEWPVDAGDTFVAP